VPTAGGTPNHFADWLITEPVQLYGGRVHWFVRSGDAAAPLVAYVDSGTIEGVDRRRVFATTPPLQAFAVHASGVYGLREGKLYFAPTGTDPTKLQAIEGVTGGLRLAVGGADLVVIGAQAWHVPLGPSGPGKATSLGKDVSLTSGGIAVGSGLVVAMDDAGLLTSTTLDESHRSLGFTTLPSVAGGVELVIRGDRAFVSAVNNSMDHATLYSCRVTPSVGDCQQVAAAFQAYARGPVGVVATADAVFWAADNQVSRFRRIPRR